MEEECRDKLRWDVHKIAKSTPDTMIRALAQKASELQLQVPLELPGPIQTATPTLVDSPHHSNPSSDSLAGGVLPPILGPIDRIASLRANIRIKRQGLSVGDLLDEDVRFLRGSLDRDRHHLGHELATLQAYISARKLEESKKQQMRNLLQKVLQSVQAEEDVECLKTVELSLVYLHAEIIRLTNILQED